MLAVLISRAHCSSSSWGSCKLTSCNRGVQATQYTVARQAGRSSSYDLRRCVNCAISDYLVAAMPCYVTLDSVAALYSRRQISTVVSYAV